MVMTRGRTCKKCRKSAKVLFHSLLDFDFKFEATVKRYKRIPRLMGIGQERYMGKKITVVPFKWMPSHFAQIVSGRESATGCWVYKKNWLKFKKGVCHGK